MQYQNIKPVSHMKPKDRIQILKIHQVFLRGFSVPLTLRVAPRKFLPT